MRAAAWALLADPGERNPVQQGQRPRRRFAELKPESTAHDAPAVCRHLSRLPGRSDVEAVADDGDEPTSGRRILLLSDALPQVQIGVVDVEEEVSGVAIADPATLEP